MTAFISDSLSKLIMAAEDTQRVKILCKKIAGISNQLTDFEEYLRTFQDDPNATELTCRLQRLKDVYAGSDDIQAELEVLQEGINVEVVRSALEKHYIRVVTAAEVLRSKFKSTDSNNRDIVHFKKFLRFDGKFEDWLSFKHKFLSVIDNHDGLSDVQKFKLLCTALSGEPANAINALPMTNANYHKAWQMLEDTYTHKRLTVERHVELLLETAPVTKETASNLRVFVNHIQHHLRSLTALNVPVQNWDALLLPILLPKLNQKTRTAFAGTLKGTQITKIETLLMFLSQRAKAQIDDSPSLIPPRSSGCRQRTERMKERETQGSR
ncbi:uncharacterized protein LOC117220561 isoform X1 [Megalopta genalis]|uniref:uncharacterized protein LOC117220561 isoform X1 n=1 Tax=Megalopta genalis TaxID=115081 RepID=UPI003FD3AA91